MWTAVDKLVEGVSEGELAAAAVAWDVIMLVATIGVWAALGDGKRRRGWGDALAAWGKTVLGGAGMATGVWRDDVAALE